MTEKPLHGFMSMTNLLLQSAIVSASSCSLDAHPVDQTIAACGAVILSQSALESHINEEIEIAHTTSALPWDAIAPLLLKNSVSTDERWALFLRLHHKHTLDPSRNPFQAFKALIKLRNLIAHHTPQSERGVDGWPAKLRETLHGKYSVGKGDGMWPILALNVHCARWACETAADMLKEYDRIERLAAPHDLPSEYPDVPWQRAKP